MKTIIVILSTFLLLTGCVLTADVRTECPDQDYWWVDDIPTPFGYMPMLRRMPKGFVTDGINRPEEEGGWLTQEEWDAIPEPEEAKPAEEKKAEPEKDSEYSL